MPASIAVRPALSSVERRAFVELEWRLMRRDPAWIPPLRRERQALLDRRHNPFFEHGEAEFFVAWRRGEPVGRISAQLDRLHLDRYRDATGFFGFFLAPDEPEVARALWEAAAGWLRARGLVRARGPFQLNINGEAGVLVEGFAEPPFLLMPHDPPWSARLLEGLGFTKAKDLYAWRYVPGALSEPTLQLAEMTRATPGLVVRGVQRRRLAAEVRTIMTIFNEAWSNNWGFVPLTERELQVMAEQLRLLVDPAIALIAELQGEPVAMSLALPNLNAALRGLDGRLFPFGAARLWWRLKVRGVRSARLVLLGIRPQFRGRPELKGLSVLLYAETHRRGVAAGYTEPSELSWTLEDNHRINHGIELMGGVRYKTYRIYERAL
ncbi:MAG: hypothetical protein KatS3mg102_0786 [Planctomycetota bacterium]|nr:MAG: hypothetical protein KatS3mg102_0786 [Planctomycetota bacterium]